MRFSNVTVTESCLTAITPTPGVVRDHVLPGDAYCGIDLAEAAAEWGSPTDLVFVRIRVVSPLHAHVAALTIDSDGFGTSVSALVGPDALAHELVEMFRGRRAVVVADEGTSLDWLGLGEIAARRSGERLRAFEHACGATREHADIHPDTWSAAHSGDPLAARWVAAAGHADLVALVASGGADVTLH